MSDQTRKKDMKRKRAQSIHTYFKPIGPISQPSEHGDGANTNDVQPSEENNPSHAEGDAQDVPVPEVTEEATKPVGKCGSDTFTVKGFDKWKKVNNGKECAFLKHMGTTPSSAHNFAVRCYENLKNNPIHIDKVMKKQTKQMVLDARLRLKTSIDAMRWLMFQACPFRGNDESEDSKNQGNFKEMIKLLASYNKDVQEVVQNAPKNAKYTSSTIQKEIASIISRKVQTSIKEEMGNSKFAILVDECRDESKKEQMAVVVRFVNIEGLIRERFLDLVHVSDTCALTLKNKIIAVLVDNGLNVQDIRGQGSSTPIGFGCRFKGVSASPKRNDELLENQAAQIAREIELGELDTGRGANQIGSLQRAGDTRWSSHHKSIKSLLKMSAATISVLRSVATDRSATRNSRGDAAGALKILNTFDFVFILHLMERIMKITDILCVKLQNKSLDIANALDCVSNTKSLLAELRQDGWESLFEDVKSFCAKHEIDIPDMDQRYVDVPKSRNKHENTTVIHHYKVDVFNVAIDQQMIELNDRFSSQVTELLDLCSSLDPRHDAFDKSKICTLVEKFYPADFTSQERDRLECELPHFQLDTLNHPEIKNCKSLADMTKGIIKTGKSSDYPMVERLLRLVITLPVSTATAEQAFSAMKLVKTRLRSKLGDDFLRHCTIVYIEKEIAAKFSSNDIIEIFDTGARKSDFKLIDM
ncbi:uncharacterized protein [Aegilops tauschii subsp. strangulata]|uniref:uncharacterized protein n=1 Tax=Aegilops tauschii subsp. strangulata TaxID=200361 RepID=UPI00098B118A